MKNSNQLEVILYSKHAFEEFKRKELVRWLATTMQPVICRQRERTKKFLLKTLKRTPAIYMS